jgi:hypothetical protein
MSVTLAGPDYVAPTGRRVNTPAMAEAEFRAKVIVLGGTPAWDEWRGMHYPHKITCPNGHTSWPRPDGMNEAGDVL